MAKVRAIVTTGDLFQYRQAHLEANGIDGQQLLGITWDQLESVLVSSNIIKKKVLACKFAVIQGLASFAIIWHFAISTLTNSALIEAQLPREKLANRVLLRPQLKISKRLSRKSIAYSHGRCSLKYKIQTDVLPCIKSYASTRSWLTEAAGISYAIGQNCTLAAARRIGLW